MARQKFVSRLDQVVEMLRQGMVGGRWRGTLPGRERLANELGCSHGTVESAMRQLASEGWLLTRGPGRRRRIQVPVDQDVAPPPVKRVRLLLHDEPASSFVASGLLARLQEAGYAADFGQKNLTELKMDVRRVARLVEERPCDAWIVFSASREILQWFAEQPFPSMALFGRFIGLPIAATGPRKAPAMLTALRRVVELGHKRIVLTTVPERMSPYPALVEQIFLDELQRLGLPAGSYNLPSVDERSGGLNACLRSLFQLTPPTAIMLGDSDYLLGTQQFLARRGLLVPEDVSLISADYSSDYRWCDPTISHYQWKMGLLIRRVVRWVDHAVQGKRDTSQKLYDAEFIEGGTIGPVRK